MDQLDFACVFRVRFGELSSASILVFELPCHFASFEAYILVVSANKYRVRYFKGGLLNCIYVGK